MGLAGERLNTEPGFVPGSVSRRLVAGLLAAVPDLEPINCNEEVVKHG